ncbi:hypothetical protein [Flavobacterium hibisci]|uniref:hypothetical protein n=1 Tax=Flavobacterium hibisci TaxID=1914462 RepID=UPI001CBBACA5|nr:hypothetical protein [Flavobacterium hibisci]MBZ4044556.1 hypothetical protein [Flavobacterium hibisci]
MDGNKSKVEPVGFAERENGSLEVRVHQNVKHLQGDLVFDGMVKHIYTFQDDGLIKKMDIELVEINSSFSLKKKIVKSLNMITNFI